MRGLHFELTIPKGSIQLHTAECDSESAGLCYAGLCYGGLYYAGLCYAGLCCCIWRRVTVHGIGCGSTILGGRTTSLVTGCVARFLRESFIQISSD